MNTEKKTANKQIASSDIEKLVKPDFLHFYLFNAKYSYFILVFMFYFIFILLRAMI